MFTGIIEEIGDVVEAGAGTLRIRAPKVLSDAHLGDSIAINGVDLTVSETTGDTFCANVMPETYRRSNLGGLKAGDVVNLERSVRPMDRLSGHIVRGVVEGRATIDSFTPEADAILSSEEDSIVFDSLDRFDTAIEKEDLEDKLRQLNKLEWKYLRK